MRSSIVDFVIISIALINLFTGFLILSRNYKSLTNRVFSAIIFVIAFWSISFVFYEIPIFLTRLFWIRLIFVFVAISGDLILFLSFIFPKLNFRRAWFYAGLYGVAYTGFSIWFIFFTNKLVSGVYIASDGSIQTIIGKGYLLWTFLTWILYIWASVNFFASSKISTGVYKVQVRYLLVAFLLWGVGVNVPDVIIPLLFNDTRFFPLSVITTLFCIIPVSYALLRHRFFDIKFIVQQFVTYLITASFTTVFFILFALAYTSFTNARIEFSSWVLIIMVSIAIPLIFDQFRIWSKYIAGKYFFQSLYDYQKTLINLSKSLSNYIEMPKLVDLIIDTLMNTMLLDRVAVLVRNPRDTHYKVQKTIGFNEENGILLVKDSFLTEYLERNLQMIALDEVKRLYKESRYQFEKEGFKDIADQMEQIEACLIVPVINNKRMISLIVLGNKKSGDSYTLQDINLLTMVVSQASIAIENARLYKEVQEFNEGLEKKVVEATYQIQTRNKQLEEANIQIGLASKVKNDLLTMASHEFRTPITIINNALWFLNKDEVKNTLTDKEKQNFERIIETMGRLNYVVNNINQMLLTTGGNLDLKLTPIQIEIIVREVIEDKKTDALEKQINLHYLEPDRLLPEIMADKVKLKYIIWELITNALKYTPLSGKVDIQTILQDDNVEIKVSDTGQGIAEKNLSSIFEGFTKLDVLHTTQPGMGLGLYIVKKIVCLHGGDICVKSEEGKGTTFTISLPLNNYTPLQSIKNEVKE